MPREEIRAPAVPKLGLALSVVAVVALNLAVAYLIARAVGMRGLQVPGLVLVLFLLLSLSAGAGAVVVFRRHWASRRISEPQVSRKLRS